MDKKSKFPVYIVGNKSGNVSKIRSNNELKFYKDRFGLNFTEMDHYPSKEEIENITNKKEA